jgi:hypothetical protein
VLLTQTWPMPARVNMAKPLSEISMPGVECQLADAARLA